MLAMLTDTIVDDTTSSPPDTNNARSNSGGDRVEEDYAFDRLDQSDISLLPYNSPITTNYDNDTSGKEEGKTSTALDGSTPRLFATIFLGGGNSSSGSGSTGESAARGGSSNVNNSQGSSGSRLHIVNAMPPPPLASMKDLSSNDFNNNTLNSNMMGSINTSNMVATTTFPPSIHPVIKCTTTGNQLLVSGGDDVVSSTIVSVNIASINSSLEFNLRRFMLLSILLLLLLQLYLIPGLA